MRLMNRSIIAGIIIGSIISIGIIFTFSFFMFRNSAEVYIVTDKGSEYDDFIKSIYKNYTGVVLITNFTNTNKPISIGTGFVYKQTDDSQFILTNYHVIVDYSKIYIHTIMNTTIKDVEVVGFDEYSDLAILKIDRIKEVSTLELGESKNLRLGQTVYAIGTPSSSTYINSVSDGIISGLNRDVNYNDRIYNMIQTTTRINPGNSGGPLINLDGEVIGINTLKVNDEDYHAMGFAIPIDYVTKHLYDLERYGKVFRPKLGIKTRSIVNMSTSEKKKYNIEAYSIGLYVLSVDPNSNADSVGIRKGDIIYQVNGKVIYTINDLNSILNTYFRNETVPVEIIRNNRVYRYNVILKINVEER